MTVTVDQMYLENLDEYIYDENLVVTFKWLSRTLEVHVNKAKQMLYAFVERQRNKRDDDRLHVIYLLAGFSCTTAGPKVLHIQLVAEENLEAAKCHLNPVTSCHMYSVQRSCLKDSHQLYATDFSSTKEHILTPNKFSAIDCERAKPSTESSQQQPIISQPPDCQIVDSRDSKCSDKRQSKSEVVKKQSIVGMFGKSNQKKTEKVTQSVNSVKHSANASKTNKTLKPDAIKSFFAQQSSKPKRVVASKVGDEAAEKVPQATKPASPEVRTAGKKKRAEQAQEGEMTVKKRRRIRQVSVSSESSADDREDSEDVEMLPERPLPDASSPPRRPQDVEEAASSDDESSSGLVADTPERTRPAGKATAQPAAGKGSGTVQPAGKATAQPAGKGSATAQPTGKGSGTAQPTGKGSGTMQPAGKASGTAQPTGKGSGTTQSTGKASGTMQPTGKASGTAQPPGKGSGTAQPAGKGSGTVQPVGKGSSTVQPAGNGADAKRRRRRRKLVSKTSITEDGYMETVKVWESDSTDVSDTEAVTKRTDPATKQSAKPAAKAEPPSQVVKTGRKQMSMMSFFQKK